MRSTDDNLSSSVDINALWPSLNNKISKKTKKKKQPELETENFVEPDTIDALGVDFAPKKDKALRDVLPKLIDIFLEVWRFFFFRLLISLGRV